MISLSMGEPRTRPDKYELSLPLALDDRLVLAGEFEPQLRAVAGEPGVALLTRDCDEFCHAAESDRSRFRQLVAVAAMSDKSRGG